MKSLHYTKSGRYYTRNDRYLHSKWFLVVDGEREFLQIPLGADCLEVPSLDYAIELYERGKISTLSIDDGALGYVVLTSGGLMEWEDYSVEIYHDHLLVIDQHDGTNYHIGISIKGWAAVVNFIKSNLLSDLLSGGLQ